MLVATSGAPNGQSDSPWVLSAMRIPASHVFLRSRASHPDHYAADETFHSMEWNFETGSLAVRLMRGTTMVVVRGLIITG